MATQKWLNNRGQTTDSLIFLLIARNFWGLSPFLLRRNNSTQREALRTAAEVEL